MKQLFFLLLTILTGGLLLAQEGETKNVNIDINTGEGGGNWYTSPWVWVVGASVFILLLVALTRGNRRAD